MELTMIDSAFWAGKKVLLTGHTGFKGSWLSLWLQQLGADVYGYALAPQTEPALFICADVARGMHSEIGDICDLQALQAYVVAVKPEIVFHLAAEPLVRASYLDPLKTFQVNVMGTANVLQAIRQVDSVRAVVVVTTDKVYQNKEWHWGYREIDPLGGFDPYSSSKACAELVTSSFRSSFFNAADYAKHRCAIATVRAGNVIGGGDYAPDRLIPDVLAALQNEQEIVLRSPSATRPWQYVLEPLHGYLVLAEHLFNEGIKYADAWNFGPDDRNSQPVQWVVAELIRAWGAGAWRSEAQQCHETTLLSVDSTKARSQLNWRTHCSLQSTLSGIVQWQHAFLRGEVMYNYCRAEIQNYQTLLTNEPGVAS
jgi:CDP-glucose 4,6-dehydratase